jgi:hypothetical protein
MSKLSYTLATVVCVSIGSQANALLSINLQQDSTTVPGFVINTFTVDSDTDLLSAVALSDLSSGSILNLSGPIPVETFSNGPGDSFVTINGNPNTFIAGGAGDLGPSAPVAAIFNDSLISLAWGSTSTDDIGLGLSLATFTFSEDAMGSLGMIVGSQDTRWSGFFSIDSGAVSLASSSSFVVIDPDPLPPTPNPNPNPNPGNNNPPTGNNPPPTGGNPPPAHDSPIPEPAGLGLLAVAAAFIGGLHRRRLRADAK